ncbi:MAG TPA: PAS domain-containing protein, partial [Candidatus Aminicenantes bacterium]|nr:PAS domain-containing protein [Candidatus Aminicenantes bacterium]
MTFSGAINMESKDVANRSRGQDLTLDQLRQQIRELEYLQAAHQSASELLQRNEARTQAFMEAIPDTLFLISREGTILDVHAAPESGLIELHKSMSGKPMEEVLPAELGINLRQKLVDLFETGRMQICQQQLTIQGEVRFFECRLAPSGDEGALAIVRDVTTSRAAL